MFLKFYPRFLKESAPTIKPNINGANFPNPMPDNSDKFQIIEAMNCVGSLIIFSIVFIVVNHKLYLLILKFVFQMPYFL